MKQRYFLLLLVAAEIPVAIRQAEPTISFTRIRHRLNLNRVNLFDRICSNTLNEKVRIETFRGKKAFVSDFPSISPVEWPSSALSHVNQNVNRAFSNFNHAAECTHSTRTHQQNNNQHLLFYF